ncbi:Flagellar basal-body rod protein FlgF [Sulfitobacter noctilucae]|uniref:DUF1217 domain-containing protein n=1 Tax=Sulfitobacter noctilucae TaxID=1342302 RepID=UPI00055A2E82|nr:DUF1217 domain-containing protein [Sulfitobacter noctilucae]KIN65917.1 Flagellar basal-body rod protein FlgF [Sulfitobacter noctilucae]
MYQPVVPASGLTGWRFLQRTYDSQFASFNQSTVLQRDTEYFADKISEISSAEELVSDRRLLSVALGAFGLQDDINNRYFIQKVLEEGTASSDTLAVRLSDSRYQDLSDAFGFGPAASNQIGTGNFAEDIIARYKAASFEVAAGTQDNALRIALYAQRELPELAARDASINTKWFTVLSDPPMRELFERAFNLPSSIGQIDIDQQLGVFKDRAVSVFGTDDLAMFDDPDMVQDAITKFIVRDQLSALDASMSGSSIALTLLQG